MWSRQGSTYQNDGLRTMITFQRAFSITLDAGDPIEEAYTAAGLPAASSLYPGTFSVFCENYTVERPSPILAIVICNYRGESGPAGSPGTQSPIDTGYKIRWGVTVEDAEIDEDWNGDPLVNANDEPITGIREKLYDDVVYIERNFLGINRYALRQYRRATNSDLFLGWPPGTARLIDDESEAVFVNGVIRYWKVRAAIQFREPYRTTPDKAWYKRVRHEGYKVRDAAGDPPHIAWDEGTKQPTTTPVLLDKDGTKAGSFFTFPRPTWLEFQTLGSLPYSALGLI